MRNHRATQQHESDQIKRAKMKKCVSSLIVILMIAGLGCSKKKEPCPVFYPVREGAKLNFISYVTNRNNEILYPFDYSERRYIYSDTVAGKVIHYYIEKGALCSFFYDDSCTIWNKIPMDLAALAVSCGFTYRDSVILSFWKPVIKVHHGVNTAWHVHKDTTFVAPPSDGKDHVLRYEFSGSAQYKGWTQVIVPENRTKKLSVRQVTWEPVSYLLYDQTTNDTLFFKSGSASDYFEPELGLVRSISDYDLLLKGKPKTFQKSTYELYHIFLPLPKK